MLPRSVPGMFRFLFGIDANEVGIMSLPSATRLRRLCFYRCVSVWGGYPRMPCIRSSGGYPSMPCRWYPSMSCSRSLRGVVSQHALQQVSRGCLLLGGLLGGFLLLGGTCSWGAGAVWGDPPGQQTATVADGTHSTGMHSCFMKANQIYLIKSLNFAKGYMKCISLANERYSGAIATQPDTWLL